MASDPAGLIVRVILTVGLIAILAIIVLSLALRWRYHVRRYFDAASPALASRLQGVHIALGTDVGTLSASHRGRPVVVRLAAIKSSLFTLIVATACDAGILFDVAQMDGTESAAAQLPDVHAREAVARLLREGCFGVGLDPAAPPPRELRVEVARLQRFPMLRTDLWPVVEAAVDLATILEGRFGTASPGQPRDR